MAHDCSRKSGVKRYEERHYTSGGGFYGFTGESASARLWYIFLIFAIKHLMLRDHKSDILHPMFKTSHNLPE